MNENKVICVDFGGKKCEISPLDARYTPAMMPEYTKMDVSASQKGQFSALFQQIPTMMAANSLSKAYILQWHDGLPHEFATFRNSEALMPLARDEHGRFVTMAEVYPTVKQAALVYGFSAMSLATGQYFLAEINHQMKVMNQSIDRILEFLYGDKKAELMSEISFVRYAHQNYASIMGHKEHRLATIQSLQEARKTAIKDIEFYLADLYATVNAKDEGDLEALVGRAFRIKECLELSIQLYVAGNILEVFYAQNYDPEYLKYVETDSTTYISKCEKQEFAYFVALRTRVDGAKQLKMLSTVSGKKFNREELLKSINLTVDSLSKEGKPELEKALHEALYSSSRAAEYCLTADGSVYLKRG